MTLFDSLQVGPFKIKNRIVLAPLVRARCDENMAPTPLVATYYVQRVSAGLMISEGTHVSPMSASRSGASGHYAGIQNIGWTKVVDAVHAAGGIFFQQLYHVGRKAIASAMPGGVAPIAPSPIAAVGGVMTKEGLHPFALPREVDRSEIPGLVDEFRVSARHAYEAGFDGVEIQGGNGFLIDQFLRDGANKRTDDYGGSVKNRARFLVEVIDAASGIFGANRVGVRLSPHFRADGFGDSDAVETFTYVAEVLGQRGIAYLHVLEGVERQTGPAVPLFKRINEQLNNPAGPVGNDEFIAPHLRRVFKGPLILNGSYLRDTAIEAVASGNADAISFGRLFISNPDLPKRLQLNAPLTMMDVATYYTPGPKGYTDYPALEA